MTVRDLVESLGGTMDDDEEGQNPEGDVTVKIAMIQRYGTNFQYGIDLIEEQKGTMYLFMSDSQEMFRGTAGRETD